VASGEAAERFGVCPGPVLRGQLEERGTERLCIRAVDGEAEPVPTHEVADQSVSMSDRRRPGRCRLDEDARSGVVIHIGEEDTTCAAEELEGLFLVVPDGAEVDGRAGSP
jgi:hypothetical protein